MVHGATKPRTVSINIAHPIPNAHDIFEDRNYCDLFLNGEKACTRYALYRPYRFRDDMW